MGLLTNKHLPEVRLVMDTNLTTGPCLVTRFSVDVEVPLPSPMDIASKSETGSSIEFEISRVEASLSDISTNEFYDDVSRRGGPPVSAYGNELTSTDTYPLYHALELA